MSEFDPQINTVEQPAADPSLMLRMQDAMHEEDGSTTKGLAIGVAVGGVAVAAGLFMMKHGLLPSFGHEVDATSKPSEVVRYFHLNESCVGGFDTKSGAEAQAHMTVKSGKIAGALGIHYDKKVPMAWIGSEVEGMVHTEICQEDADVKAVYKPTDHSLAITLPNSALFFKATMPPESRRTAQHSGALVVGGELMAKIQQIVTDKGMPNAINDSYSALSALAEMQADQTVVENCAEKVQSLYQADVERFNKDDFLAKAKIFGTDVDPTKVSVSFEGPAPTYSTQYGDALDALHDKRLEIHKGKTETCTVSPDVAQQIQTTIGAQE